MPQAVLTPHPHTPCAPVTRIEVWVGLDAPARLNLGYRIRGAVQAVRIPRIRPSERTDELWRHTCCEAFVQIPGDVGYWECNLSPSTQWAFYRFGGYRTGMTPVTGAQPLGLSTEGGRDHFDLRASLDLRRLPIPPGTPRLHLGLAVVIEMLDGGRAYWALHHPPGQPDFHHPAGFALRLPYADALVSKAVEGESLAPGSGRG